MAFRDFFRGDRDRDEDERGRERWRSMGGDWRDENRGRRDWDRGEDRDQSYAYGVDRAWSPSGDDYSERTRAYRSGGEGERGERWGREREERTARWGEDRGGYGGPSGYGGSGRWDEDQQRSGYSGRGAGSDVYSRYYGGGASGYTGSGYGGNYSRGAGQSYGGGGYGRDMEQGRRGALGYGGYGGMGGAETGSSALSSWRDESQYGEQQAGDHRGKGPRGYRRSDQRIHEEVCDCLTDDPRIDASNIDVTVKECEVTLSGAVSSREEKRRAEDLIARLSGVKDVTNNLRVQQQPQAGSSENMASPSARH